MYDFRNPKHLHQQLEQKRQRKQILNQLYHTPANLRLKYFSLGAGVLIILLLTVMTIWLDDISYKAMLFMRGCCGLFAIISVVLYAILTYRVNRAYQQQQDKNPTKSF